MGMIIASPTHKPVDELNRSNAMAYAREDHDVGVLFVEEHRQLQGVLVEILLDGYAIEFGLDCDFHF
jgi:hypothetical protein